MSHDESSVGMKKTMGLMGIIMNVMALIVPSAFLWITYQVQAVQKDPAEATTAPDMIDRIQQLVFSTMNNYQVCEVHF